MPAGRHRRRRRSHPGKAAPSSRKSRSRAQAGSISIGGAVDELQETVGNKAVTALLRQAAAPAKDKKRPTSRGDSEVPGLNPKVANQLRDLLAQKKRQQALDLVVKTMAARGDINLALLKDGKMHFKAAFPMQGSAKEPGYETDPATGRQAARPTLVRLGPSAFKDPSVLYSTIVHEYQHVIQFQTSKTEAAKTATGGQEQRSSLIRRQELEAYAAEIFRAKESGLWWKPDELQEIWRRLHSRWLKLELKGRKLLNAMYVRAYELVKRAIGRHTKLPFGMAR